MARAVFGVEHRFIGLAAGVLRGAVPPKNTLTGNSQDFRNQPQLPGADARLTPPLHISEFC